MCHKYYLVLKIKISISIYIDIYKKVMECILNNTLLDDVIDLLLKEKKNYYTVYQLINIKQLML